MKIQRLAAQRKRPGLPKQTRLEMSRGKVCASFHQGWAPGFLVLWNRKIRAVFFLFNRKITRQFRLKSTGFPWFNWKFSGLFRLKSAVFPGTNGKYAAG